MKQSVYKIRSAGKLILMPCSVTTYNHHDIEGKNKWKKDGRKKESKFQEWKTKIKVIHSSHDYTFKNLEV